MSPIPQFRATLAAVRTTPSASSDCSPLRARALEYRFVVATFRKANRYVAPSKKVVAGPNAANCFADSEAGPDSPTKDVSTRERSGPETQRARQGMANLRNSLKVGVGGKVAGRVAVPPPRMESAIKDSSWEFTSLSDDSDAPYVFGVDGMPLDKTREMRWEGANASPSTASEKERTRPNTNVALRALENIFASINFVA